MFGQDFPGARAGRGIVRLVLRLVYPVKCIYITTDPTNPVEIFGFGTWTAFGSGKVPVGVSVGDPDFGTVEATGGAKTVALTSTQIPALNVDTYLTDTGSGQIAVQRANVAPGDVTPVAVVNSSGGGGSHNNLQPFIAVYMWKRTA